MCYTVFIKFLKYILVVTVVQSFLVHTCSNVQPYFLHFQRRTKQKVVTDLATLSKGASTGTKSRTPLKQVFFSQGVPDKVSEVLCCAHQTTRAFLRNRYRLAVKASAHSKAQICCALYSVPLSHSDTTCTQN